jgi:uncharacterized repeat protein (TIGR01451 family)
MNQLSSRIVVVAALLLAIPLTARALSGDASRTAKPISLVGGSSGPSTRHIGTTTRAGNAKEAAVVAPSACLKDTSQADFEAGVPTNVDLLSSPGDAILLAPSSIDQQNTTVGVVGLGFSSTTWFGQTFTPGVTGVLSQVDLDLFCADCSGTTPDITVSIRNVVGSTPGGTDLATATIPGFSSADPAYLSAIFSPAPHLTAGSFYAIVVHSNADPSTGSYSYAVGYTNPYPGGHTVQSTNGGASWATLTTDIGFKTYMRTTFAASGDLISSTKDGNPSMGSPPSWTTLSWNASTPANTSLRFQVAASASSGGPFNFVGPDGTAATYYTSNGASLLQFAGSRYLQYRAYLATTDNTMTPVLESATVCYVQGMPSDISISNSDGVASATPGASVVYTITASNGGPGDAAGVTVADAFPASLSCTWTCNNAGGGTCTASGSGDISDPVGLPNGTSVAYSATCQIPPASTGSLANTATVTYAGDANLSNNSATDTDTLSPKADLGITNSDGVTTAVPGSSVSYTIIVSNAGPSDAPGSTVTDSFPAAVTCTWTCGGAGGGSCTASGSGNIDDPVGLPSGGSVTYSASCSISAAATGTLSDTATVATSGSVADPTPGNNSATDIDTLTVQADVIVTASDSRSFVQIGDVVDYVIEVTNPTGPSAAVATVTDSLPAELANGSWVCTGTGSATCNDGSGNMLSDTATLPVGGKAAYVYSATVLSAGVDDQIVNTASASLNSGSDGTPGNNTGTDTDIVVIYRDGFEGPQALLQSVNAAGADFVTARLSVDASLLNGIGIVPVPVASGRSADGRRLFTLQLARFGDAVAMRTLTTDVRGATEMSTWQVVNPNRRLLEFAWQSASAAGNDGYFAAASGGSPILIDERGVRDRLRYLSIPTENSVPWVLLIDQ